MNRTTYLLPAICASALLSGGCKVQPTTAHASAGPSAMPVQVQPVKVRQVPDVSVYIANLRSRASAAINPEVEGQVTRINVKSGDHVKAGTVILQIDPVKQQAVVTGQEQQYAAQVANVTYAKQQFERTSYLAKSGVIAAQELELAQSTLDSAQALLQAIGAQVKEQREQLRHYQVSAPTDGIIGDIPVRPGDRVSRTTLLTTINKPEDLEAYIPVPVERASSLRHGLPVEYLDTDGKVIGNSTINFIAPEVTSDTQSVLAKAPIAGRDFRTQEYVRTRIVWGVFGRPVVPVLAVSRINGQPFVFVARADRNAFAAQQKPVRLGETVGNDYAVLDGVAAGEDLIVTGTQMLGDGMPIAPIRAGDQK